MLEMILKIDGTVGNFPTLKEFRESGEGLTVGGFCFRVQVNGKMLDVNFDFPAYAANVLSDNTLMFEAGAATFSQTTTIIWTSAMMKNMPKWGFPERILLGKCFRLQQKSERLPSTVITAYTLKFWILHSSKMEKLPC